LIQPVDPPFSTLNTPDTLLAPVESLSWKASFVPDLYAGNHVNDVVWVFACRYSNGGLVVSFPSRTSRKYEGVPPDQEMRNG
jgi:hypothetical protein